MAVYAKNGGRGPRPRRHQVFSWLLVDPVELCGLPGDDLFLGEPESDLLLRALHSVRAVADIAANVDGVVAADRAGSGGERVRGAEDRCALSVSQRSTGVGGDGRRTSAGLAGVAAFPDHGDDRTAQHVYNVIS